MVLIIGFLPASAKVQVDRTTIESEQLSKALTENEEYKQMKRVLDSLEVVMFEIDEKLTIAQMKRVEAVEKKVEARETRIGNWLILCISIICIVGVIKLWKGNRDEGLAALMIESPIVVAAVILLFFLLSQPTGKLKKELEYEQARLVAEGQLCAEDAEWKMLNTQRTLMLQSLENVKERVKLDIKPKVDAVVQLKQHELDNYIKKNSVSKKLTILSCAWSASPIQQNLNDNNDEKRYLHMLLSDYVYKVVDASKDKRWLGVKPGMQVLFEKRYTGYGTFEEVLTPLWDK